MDKNDVAALAAETLLMRAFMLELLDGMAADSTGRRTFLHAFISGLHRRLDAIEQASASPRHREILEIARVQADGLLTALGG